MVEFGKVDTIQGGGMRICAKLALSGAKFAKVSTIWTKLSLSEGGIGPNLVNLALSGLSYHYPRVQLDQIGLSWHYRRGDLGQS